MAALGRLAGPKDVSAMVKGLLKAEKGRERDDAEKAIVRVCQLVREKDKQAEPVLAAIANAADADKAAVLPLVGRLGGPKAMELVQAALKSANAELGDAAVRALFNWPDASTADLLLDIFESAKDNARRIAALQALVRVTTPQDRAREPKLPALDKALPLVRAALDDKDKAVREAAVRALVDWPASAAAPDLLALAKGAPEPNFRILALRGFIRLAGLVAARSAQEGVGMHQEAMKLATQPDERRRVLSGLGEVRAVEALNIVLPCLDDKDVAGEAAAAAVAIADRLRDTHPKEVKAAVEKVLESSKDRRLIRRAEEILKHVAAKLGK
jgi:HEAT repeat protein